MAEELIAGRYRLLEPLGRGAMSAVWEAEDRELARRVAVKMLGPAADPQRFEREARAAAALSHPNIVSLYDYGRSDGRPYMVLELLPGGSLEDRLRDGRPLADEDAHEVAREIAAGLAHAHERGLVHRDLKPANILFDAEGRAKIADFGIVRVGGGGTLTEAGTVLGTASYISPEQASGQPAGPPSDVYSFGVILFRLLTGRLPFVSRNAMELVRMHRDVPAPSVSDVRPDAPADLAGLADAALAKDPGHRPQDGAALLGALRGDDTAATRILPSVGQAILPSVGQAGRVPAPRRRRERALPIGIAVAVLLAGGAALALAVTRGGGGGGGTTPTRTAPGLSLPTVPSATIPGTVPVTTTGPPTTTAPRTTTATVPTTTAAPTTSTVPTTTAPTTTAAPTTTVPATTTPATTTVPTTTTAPTTPATTTAPITT